MRSLADVLAGIDQIAGDCDGSATATPAGYCVAPTRTTAPADIAAHEFERIIGRSRRGCEHHAASGAHRDGERIFRPSVAMKSSTPTTKLRGIFVSEWRACRCRSADQQIPALEHTLARSKSSDSCQSPRCVGRGMCSSRRALNLERGITSKPAPA